MTEEEWLVCADPNLMLAHVGGRASARTRRLFAAACCRRNWHLLEDDYSRRAVDAAEGYADGLVSFEEWLSAHANATDARCNAAMSRGSSSAASYAARAAFYALNTDDCMEPEEGPFAQAAAESVAFAAAASQPELAIRPVGVVSCRHGCTGAGAGRTSRPRPLHLRQSVPTTPDALGRLAHGRRPRTGPGHLRRPGMGSGRYPCPRAARGRLRRPTYSPTYAAPAPMPAVAGPSMRSWGGVGLPELETVPDSWVQF